MPPPDPRPRPTRVALGLLALGPLFAACQMDSPSESHPARSGNPEADLSEAERVLIGDVNWYVDYETALEVARQVDKPLWMHFGENPG